MWPRFKSRRWHHMWVVFVVGSLLCSERFFSRVLRFSPPIKNQHFQGRRRTTMWMYYLQIVIYSFIYLALLADFFSFFRQCGAWSRKGRWWGKKASLSSQPPPFYASISCHISVHYYGRNKLKFSIHYYVWKRLAKGQSSKRIIRLCFFAFCVSFAVNLVTTRSTF